MLLEFRVEGAVISELDGQDFSFVVCVRIEMWNTLGRRWEKPLDDLMAMSSLDGWDSEGRPAVYCCTELIFKTFSSFNI